MKQELKLRKKSLQKKLKTIQELGHVVNVSNITSPSEGVIGVEIFLDSKYIHPTRANRIASYIQETYEFQSFFYPKNNTIKVFYKL
jgi:hypothetical protein